MSLGEARRRCRMAAEVVSPGSGEFRGSGSIVLGAPPAISKKIWPCKPVTKCPDHWPERRRLVLRAWGITHNAGRCLAPPPAEEDNFDPICQQLAADQTAPNCVWKPELVVVHGTPAARPTDPQPRRKLWATRPMK